MEKMDLICGNCQRKYVIGKHDDMPENALALGMTDCENCEPSDPCVDDWITYWIYKEEG